MKKITFMLMMAFGMMALSGCSSVNKQEITDTETIKALDEQAKQSLKQYFEMTVDENIEMNKSAIKNVPKEIYADRVPETLVYTAQMVNDPKDGELYSYGVMVKADTQEVKGVYTGVYSEAEGQTYTDEAIDEIAQSFIRAHGLIPENESLELMRVAEFKKANFIKMATYKYGEQYLLINVSTQNGQVICFEYSM